MSDEALIVDKTGSIFLAGSYLVKAAIGETIDNETLGGSISQTDLSGVIDDRFPDDKSCLDRIRFLVDKIGNSPKAGFDRTEPLKPNHETNDIFGILPSERSKPYKSLEIIKRLVDKSEFEQYKATYGKTIICGYARINGWAVGIVANNREIIKNKKGEMQFGGVIYSDSADKAARFIMNCNQKKIPLVFLQDVTGFMVGSRSEHGGIIKDGSKMVNAMSNSTVPKFTIVIGNSYGAGNYAMCGKAYDPRLIVAWPSAKIAVMGGEQAAKVLLQIEKASLSKKGEEISPEKETELLENIINRYNNQTTPTYAASRLWVDEIINPLDTRKWISTGIEIANNAPIKKYNVGVIQT
jgi:acetyl-CoA carboxylase carboxyltransferase component